MIGVGLASPFLFFVAFLLLLLVTLATPIIKSIFLFDIIAKVSVGSGLLSASIQDKVRFGIFGWCSSALSAHALTFTENLPAQCSARHLGFTVTPQLQQLLSDVNLESLVKTVQHALSAALVLHPIACGLTFLAFLFSLLAVILRHTRIWDFFATGTGILAAFISTIATVVDIVFVAIAKHRLHTETQGDATVGFGNAVWMTLVAAILTWIACVAACCGIIRGRRARRDEATRY